MRKYESVLLAFTGLILAYCATAPVESGTAEILDRASVEIVETTQQPLEDFNFIREEIPLVLVNAEFDPYAEPEQTNCQTLVSEIQQLNLALGADLDIADDEDRTAVDVTFSLARSLALGLIPLRGVTREVTGAAVHSREFNEAVLAGTVRRAYLKGIGEWLGCEYPAAPLQQPHRGGRLARPFRW